jgi:hypothetical protein
MTAYQWVVRSLASLAMLPLVAYYGARLHDGPIGAIPGGPLGAGEVVREPIADWTFARDTGEIELQLDSQQQSRTVWFFVLDGTGYVPSNLGFAPGEIWHRQALVNGAAKLRIAGKLYPVTLSKLGDAIAEQMSDRVRAELTRKYGKLPPGDKGVWLFQVTSHPAAVG